MTITAFYVASTPAGEQLQGTNMLTGITSRQTARRHCVPAMSNSLTPLLQARRQGRKQQTATVKVLDPHLTTTRSARQFYLPCGCLDQ